jgi:hypothetical protein
MGSNPINQSKDLAEKIKKNHEGAGDPGEDLQPGSLEPNKNRSMEKRRFFIMKISSFSSELGIN